ncbi:MAG: hypothetical protein IJZ68_09580 [Bacteroidaceae bacterium]|nr:hypothetical protein [Bacteroidaceae bacterium]
MKKLTVFGVILAIIVLGIYATEAYDTIRLMWGYVDPVVYGVDVAFQRLFEAYPWWWLLCTFGTILCGVLAPILYFCKSVHSIECAYSAFGLDVLTFVLNATFRQSWATVFSAGSGRNFIFAIIVAFLTLAFAGYLSSRKEYGYHSTESGWRFLGSR